MIRTLSYLWVGTFAGAACAFLTQVILARALGPNSFGAFTAALSLVTILSPLAGFGVSALWLKVFGEEGGGGVRWVAASINFTKISTLLTMLGVAAWGWLGPHASDQMAIYLLLSLYIAGFAAIELAGSVFQLEEKYHYLAAWQFLPHFLRFVIILLAWLLLGVAFSVWVPALIYACVAFVMLASGALPIGRLIKGRANLVGHRKMQNTHALDAVAWKKVAKSAWPFGVAGIFYLVFLQGNIVMIKYLAGDQAAGQYGVAFTVVAAVYMFPSVIYQKFLLPKIHRWASHEPQTLRIVHSQGGRIMLFLGLAAGLVVAWVGPDIMLFFFGKDYKLAGDYLIILAAAVPIRFVSTAFGALLVTGDNMRLKVRYMGFVSIVSVILGVALITVFGAKGAAISTVTCEGVLLVLYYWAVNNRLFKKVYI